MRSETPARDGALESAEGGDRSVVVRLLRDLRDELAVRDLARRIQHDDGARHEAGHRPLGELDAEGLSEVAAEGRRDLDVLDALRSAEARLREREVRRHVE